MPENVTEVNACSSTTPLVAVAGIEAIASARTERGLIDAGARTREILRAVHEASLETARCAAATQMAIVAEAGKTRELLLQRTEPGQRVTVRA